MITYWDWWEDVAWLIIDHLAAAHDHLTRLELEARLTEIIELREWLEMSAAS